jgi:uncharacterized protein YecE (DUF72 family)
MEFYVGCPIWANKEWVDTLYPKGTKPADFLRLYAQQLTTVEGNTTFYAVPSLATVQKWAEETPETFRFCPKLPRAVSHAGKLMDHQAEAMQFLAVMSRLGSRLGPLFLQLPPSYSPANGADLREFLEAWPAEVQLAVEVRHPAWFNESYHRKLQELLSGFGMARVIIDTRPIRSLAGDQILEGSVYKRMLQARERKPDVPVIPEPTAPFTFLRYIGHPLIDHNVAYLDEWAGYLSQWLQEGRDAYVFCHCPDERMDPQLCRELHQRVAEKAPIAPLPQLSGGDFASQGRLF